MNYILTSVSENRIQMVTAGIGRSSKNARKLKNSVCFSFALAQFEFSVFFNRNSLYSCLFLDPLEM